MDSPKIAEQPSGGTAEEFCQKLRDIRTDAGYTIKRAALATRISQPFLEALEEGRFNELPGAVFGRGFLRSLCKIYRFRDEQELLREFDLACTELGVRDIGMGVQTKEEHAPAFLDRKKQRWLINLRGILLGRYLRTVPFLSILVLLVGTIVGLFFLIRGGSEKLPKPAAKKGVAAVVPAVTTPPAPKKIVVPEKKPAVAALPIGSQRLEFYFPKKVRLKFKIDQEEWQSQEFSGQQNWTFKRMAHFYLNNPEGVRVDFNDQPIGPLKAGLGFNRLVFERDAPEEPQTL